MAEAGNYWPKISIWVAARNEENTILNCLKGLANQNYDKGNWEVLIGNDQSTDDTADQVRKFILDKPHFKLINIDKTVNGQRGKANVLANLYEHSTGDFFLITDADVQMPTGWAKAMTQNFIEKPNLGHLVGITSVNVKGIFSYLQALDWLWALTLLKWASLFKIPLTGLGNNSAVSRKAYESTGGYAKIPFSITEDFALFHEVVAKGFDFFNAFDISVFSKTESMPSLREFLHQRKRWMVGALQCPIWVVTFLYFQAFFCFILIGIGLFYSWDLALNILIIKVLMNIFLFSPSLLILKEFHLLPGLIIYEFYAWLWGLTMVIFYYLPIQIDWKGRIYTN